MVTFRSGSSEILSWWLQLLVLEPDTAKCWMFQIPGLPTNFVRQDSVPARPGCFQSSFKAGLGPETRREVFNLIIFSYSDIVNEGKIERLLVKIIVFKVKYNNLE